MEQTDALDEADAQMPRPEQTGKLSRWAKTRWPYLLGFIPPVTALTSLALIPSPSGH